MTPLLVNPNRFRFRGLVGTGGIGSGQFFALNGDHTLGREESRTGRFLDRRDYCKLHIVAHYARTLLGPDFPVYPIGRVGLDAPGQRLQAEMQAAGLDLRHVRAVPGAHTLFCICLIYPDGSGGNLTVDTSASAQVTAADIQAADPEMAALGAAGLALAVPEVPLAARAELLARARRHGLFRAAAFVSAEIAAARAGGLLADVDLLALNLDEAAVLAEVRTALEPAETVQRAVAAARGENPSAQVSITGGRRGSWVWDGNRLWALPAHPVKVAGAAGAGDTHLAALLCGLAAGLNLGEAHDLAALAAGLSVTSPHTIDPDLDRVSLAQFAQSMAVPLAPVVSRLLGLT